jgi:hypothetical protein
MTGSPWLNGLSSGSTLDVSASTIRARRSHLDSHLPRFGDTPLNSITRMAIKRWVKDLNRSSRADSTVASILSLLSMIIGEAVEERRIATNPAGEYVPPQPHGRNGPGPPPQRSTRSPAASAPPTKR